MNIKAKILFIESFCRVKDLSLTGKLLKPILKILALPFIVMWPELEKKYKKDGAILFDTPLF